MPQQSGIEVLQVIAGGNMVDSGLVRREMEKQKVVSYQPINPTNSLLERLSRRNEVKWMSVHYYDDEERAPSERMKNNNWEEGYGAGDWGLTQRHLDNWAWQIVLNKRSYSRKNRWYLCRGEAGDSIYFLGRDCEKTRFADIWIVFRTRKPNTKMLWKRKSRDTY